MSDTYNYKCPNCDGGLEFNSNVGQMKCPYCDTEIEIEGLKDLDNDLKEQGEQEDIVWRDEYSQWSDEDKKNIGVFQCQTCSGEIVGDANLAASECPYCGNPVVFLSRLSGEYRPDYVIPFKLDKEEAMKKLRGHYEGKFLLPKEFKTENKVQEIKALYVPFWLFDADADVSCVFKGTRSNTYTRGDYRITHTKHYSLIRAGKMSFDNIAIDGSTKMDDTLMESITPFNFSEAVDFQTAYLSGFFADKYDVSADQCVVRANQRIKSSGENILRSEVHGYSTVSLRSTNMHLSNQHNDYALYPIWLLKSKYNGKEYTFAMNGQTGKFVGNLPCDYKLAALYFFGIWAVVAIVACIIAIFM